MNKPILAGKKLFLIFSFFAVVGCEENAGSGSSNDLQKANLKIDSLTAEITVEKARADSLLMIVEEKDMFLASDTVYFGKDFKGISNPAEFIKDQLKSHPEKIPLAPVLGGTMQFRKIEILDNTWLYAMYDDGHIQGASIFQYSLNPDGTLEFRMLLSRSGE